MKHIARKRFGQHFLTDSAVIDAIVDAIAPSAGDAMVEIGPGLAALTQPLVERLGHLTVIELDRDLAVRLRAHGQLEVIESDVLKVDFTALAGAQATRALRVVGNLPYNISTPILFHLLDHVNVVQDQHFMLQKEVIDRMVARPATSDYSRLSVMLQWRYEMHPGLCVPPESVVPPPRVDSAIVRVAPLGFFIYGGLIAVQSLWAGPWLTRVGGWSMDIATRTLTVTPQTLAIFALPAGHPLTLDDLPFARYQVRVVQPGYGPGTEVVTLSASAPARSISRLMQRPPRRGCRRRPGA